MRKKLISVYLIIILSLLFSTKSLATNDAKIYSDTIYTKENSIVFIPVKIINGSGLMGFRITVEYDPELFSCPVVSRGELIQEGIIDDTIASEGNGKFDVLWNNTENVMGNGTLFTISFNTPENLSASNSQINLSYKPEDTFDEKYNDVVLNCSPISVVFGEKPEEAYTEETKYQREKTNNDVLLSVENALKLMDYENIKSIPEQEQAKFIETVNYNLSLVTGYKENTYELIDELYKDYTNGLIQKFKNELTNSTDDIKIVDIIDDTLKEIEELKIDDLSENKADQFIDSFEDKLKEKSPDITTISDYVDNDEYLSIVKDLYSLHSLRHTNASLLIAADTDVVTVAGRFGHANSGTTLKVYSHMFKARDEIAANAMAAIARKSIQNNA